MDNNRPEQATVHNDASWYSRKRWQLLLGVLVFACLAMLWGLINTIYLPESTAVDYVPFGVMLLAGMGLLLALLSQPRLQPTIAVATVWLISLTMLIRVAVVLFGHDPQDLSHNLFNGVWGFVPLQPIACHVLLQRRSAVLVSWLFAAGLALLLAVFCLYSGQVPADRAELRYAVGVVGLALPVAILFLRYFHIAVIEHEQTRRDLALSRELLQTEKQLSETRERLNLVLQTSGCGTWEWDASGNHVTFDEAQHRLYGLSPGSFDGRRESLMRLVHPIDRPRLIAALDEAVRQRDSYSQEYRVVLGNGRVREISDRGQVLRDEAGRAQRMIGISFDVTDARSQFRAAEAKQRELELLADALPSAVAYVERDSLQLRFANARFRQWFSGHLDPVGIPARLDKAIHDDLQRALKGVRQESEFQLTLPTVGLRWYRATIIPNREEHQEIHGAYVIVADVSQQRANEETLRHHALHDSLTGIYNRRYFDENFEKEWRRSQRNGQPVSLLMIDIDFFKQYNDGLGHEAGDDCLRRVASCLASQVGRPADFVARYGGEEFVMLLPETPPDGGQRIAEAIMQAIHDLQIPHPSADRQWVSVSIGVATAEHTDQSSPQSLLQDADKALYTAKQDGRARFVISPPAT